MLTWTRSSCATGMAEPRPVPIGSPGTIPLSLSGRAVLIAAGRAYALRADGRGWTMLAIQPALPIKLIAGASGDARAALVDATGHIETLSLTGDRLVLTSVAPVPARLSAIAMSWDADKLVIGGISPDGVPRLFGLTSHGWVAEPAWPGGRPVALAAQNRTRSVVLSDARTWRWSPGQGWRVGAPAPSRSMVGGGIALGQAHLLFTIAQAAGSTLFSYSTITDAWAPIAHWRAGHPIGTVASAAGLLALSVDRGNLRVWRVALGGSRRGLASIDVGIVAAYMLAMLGMGLHFYRRTSTDSSSDFFLGNRAIPSWAAGLSMFAGTIGSVNYLAYPAKSFETDWQYLMSKLTYVGALFVVAVWLAPFFRRLNLVSVNTYLEDRFALGIRLLASGLWIVLQLGARMGIILYLPALAINTMTGVDIVPCILTVGVFTMVYTALGGMRAVVWTDVIQVFVLVGGALFAIGFIIHDLGLGQLIGTTSAFHKTHAINVAFDVRQPTIWTFLSLAVLEGILCFPRDQIVMQRVMATATPREASRSILTFAAILTPCAVLFYGIGTALFAFYRVHPGALDPTRPIDAVFPTFIGTQLPHGVVGLVIAGVLAAAMGVLSGIIHSVATLL